MCGGGGGGGTRPGKRYRLWFDSCESLAVVGQHVFKKKRGGGGVRTFNTFIGVPSKS